MEPPEKIIQEFFGITTPSAKQFDLRDKEPCNLSDKILTAARLTFAILVKVG